MAIPMSRPSYGERSGLSKDEQGIECSYCCAFAALKIFGNGNNGTGPEWIPVCHNHANSVEAEQTGETHMGTCTECGANGVDLHSIPIHSSSEPSKELCTDCFNDYNAVDDEEEEEEDDFDIDPYNVN